MTPAQWPRSTNTLRHESLHAWSAGAGSIMRQAAGVMRGAYLLP